MVCIHKGSRSAFLSFLGWYFSSKSEYVFQKEPWQKELFAKYISESSFIEELNQDEFYQFKEVEMLNFKEEDYTKKDAIYLSPILKLKKYVIENLREYLLDFLIHGSMSTLDYCIGWSDLDTLIIIKKEILPNPNKLLDLRKHILNIIPLLYEIDPLQHHEFIITTEKAMLHESYALLPSETIRYSKSLLGRKSLKIAKYRNNISGKRNLFAVNNLFKKSKELGYMDHHKRKNIALEDNFKNRQCMYQLKYFLSCVMIIPTYYLDSMEKSCYKKSSFENFYSNIKINSEILKKSSEIRKIWPTNERFPYKSNFIPDWICEVLGNNYFERAYTFTSEIKKSLLNIKK